MQEWWQLAKHKKKLDRQLPRLKRRRNKSDVVLSGITLTPVM
jgi:hypothetical protein